MTAKTTKTPRATLNKRKGAQWESALSEWMRANGFPRAERRHLAGVNDKGDLAGIVDHHDCEWVIEAKDCATWELKTWMAEAAKERGNAGADYQAGVVRRRGSSDPGEAYVIVPLAQWALEHASFSLS